MSKKPINIFQAINDGYTAKQNKFINVLKEMESIALEEHNKEESNELVKQLTIAMAETIKSIFKAYITIYEVKPIKKVEEEQSEVGNA